MPLLRFTVFLLRTCASLAAVVAIVVSYTYEWDPLLSVP